MDIKNVSNKRTENFKYFNELVEIPPYDYATEGIARTPQTIYYDSMTTLKHYRTMTGYTFIGWASEKYYASGSLVSRFIPQPNISTPKYWDSTSVWFDTTKYFVQRDKSAEENMLLYLQLSKS
jgi:hypothetical protein